MKYTDWNIPVSDEDRAIWDNYYQPYVVMCMIMHRRNQRVINLYVLEGRIDNDN